MKESDGDIEAHRHPQNPLIPPARGSDHEGRCWRGGGETPADSLDGGDNSGVISFVTGDLSTFSARVTVCLVPILLVLLIVVLIQNFRGPAGSSEGEAMESLTSAGVMEIETIAQAPEQEASEPETVTVSVPAPTEETEVEKEVVAEVVQATVADKGGVTAAEPDEPQRSEEEVVSEPIAESEEVTVKGILYSLDNPSAIIGNRIVHVGDLVLEARVVRITKDRGVFETSGRRWDRGVQEAVAMP